MRRTILAIVFVSVALVNFVAHASTIQFLTPAGSPTGIAYGVDGLNVVGQDVLQRGFLYNGTSFSHPFSIEGAVSHNFHGISGNRIVGEYNDRPFVYVIPEPSTFLLAILGAGGLFAFARRLRNRASR